MKNDLNGIVKDSTENMFKLIIKLQLKKCNETKVRSCVCRNVTWKYNCVKGEKTE